VYAPADGHPEFSKFADPLSLSHSPLQPGPAYAGVDISTTTAIAMPVTTIRTSFFIIKSP
jgi:hypothetical protein